MLKDKKLSQCPICNGLMSGISSRGICADCFDEDDRMFRELKTSIRFGEKICPFELADKSGFHIKHIKRWFDQGKLG